MYRKHSTMVNWWKWGKSISRWKDEEIPKLWRRQTVHILTTKSFIKWGFTLSAPRLETQCGWNLEGKKKKTSFEFHVSPQGSSLISFQEGWNSTGYGTFRYFRLIQNKWVILRSSVFDTPPYSLTDINDSFIILLGFMSMCHKIVIISPD